MPVCAQWLADSQHWACLQSSHQSSSSSTWATGCLAPEDGTWWPKTLNQWSTPGSADDVLLDVPQDTHQAAAQLIIEIQKLTVNFPQTLLLKTGPGPVGPQPKSHLEVPLLRYMLHPAMRTRPPCL